MAHLFQKKDRHVIPNWRSFENTARLGELNGSKSIDLVSTFKPDISDLIKDWTETKNIGIAADILGVALTCNQEDHPIIQEISKFIISNKNHVTNALIAAANEALKEKNSQIELQLDLNSINIFKEKINLVVIHKKIFQLKKSLIFNPHNSINWVEIARLYSILGQDKKAERAIKTGYYLSPNNRFILRSICRFFVHIGDVDFAHDLIRKSNLVFNCKYKLY